MQQFNFISIKLTIFLVVGIVVGYYVEPKLLHIAMALPILLVFLVVAYKKQSRNGFPFFGIIAGAGAVLLGLFIVSKSIPKNNSDHYSNHIAEGANTWHVKVEEILKTSDYAERYYVSAKNVNQHKAIGNLVLRISKDSSHSPLHIDDELILFSEAESILKPLNPHQFNYRDYLKKKRIYHQLDISKNQYILKTNTTKTLLGHASNFRAGLIEKLRKEGFGKDELAIMQALLLGQRNDISNETYTHYKKAGAVHILAVSGLHIGILLLLLQFVLKPLELLPKGKTIKLVVLVICLWAFAFIAGLSASTVRAVTMFSFIAYAMYLNRPTNTFNIIALSIFFILLIQPLFLFQVGFQMSYAAVIAIVWIYPKLQRFWFPKNKITRKVWQLLTVSFAAQLGVLPISLFYFHQFPALFFVSSLIVIPFLGLILGAGILVLVLSWLSILPPFMVSSYNFLIYSMNTVIEFIATQEAFVFSAISFDTIQLVLGYMISISLVTAFYRPRFRSIAIMLLSVVVLQSWILYKEFKTSTKQQLVLAHETANSILLKQNGNRLETFGRLTDFSEQILQDYKIAERIDTITYSQTKNSFAIKNSKLYLLDSVGVYPIQKQLDYLVLTYSPKINLDRLLDSIQIRKVIVDGSNYKSYVRRWEATCLKRKLPFHYTGEMGAYYFE